MKMCEFIKIINNFSVRFLFFTLLLVATINFAAGKTYPCDYSETVNITDGLRLKDGSYSYQGLIIPANMTSEYKFKVIDGVEYWATKHMRGCVCLLKPCVSFCCPQNMVFDEMNQNCSFHSNTQHTKLSHIEVTFNNGTMHVVNIQENFIIRYELGCTNKFIDRTHENFWKWDLFQNGTLSRDGKLWSTDEYCFTPLEHRKVWSLTPLICERFQRGFRMWIYVICTGLAILINIFIFLMLISIKDVRNSIYGESVIFYLASLIVGISALLYLSLKNPMNLSETACRNIGFLAYFFIILSFFFLSIISWDFWYAFKQKRLHGWRRKLLYLVIIAITIGLKFIARYVQVSDLPRILKPGIGDSFCWFDVRLWGILIFYYLPIILLLGFSIFCCAKAYCTLWNLPNDTQMITGCEKRVVKSHFNAFFIYILAVLCVWMREIIVYITAHIREQYFLIDFWTGICILGLTLTGFFCLLYKNRHFQSWWRINVSNESKDLDSYGIPMYSQPGVAVRLSEFKGIDDPEIKALK